MTTAPASVSTPPAPIAPATPAPAASPKSPVPPAVGSNAAHLAAARNVFAPDPARTPETPKPAEAAKTPDAVPGAEPAKTPEAPSVIKKTEAPKASESPPVEFPEDKLPEPATEAAKAGWKELKAITKAERNRATVAEARLKELEAKSTSTPANVEETERLKAELKTYSDRLLVLDLQNHPDFHRQYREPVKKAFAESAQLLTDNGVDGNVDFDALLAKPRVEFAKTVSELASKMNAFDGQTFTANMREAFRLRGEEKMALDKAGDVQKQFENKAAAEQKKAFEAVAADVVPNFEKREVTPEMSAEEKSSVEAYNQSVDSIRATAERLSFGKVGPKDVAMMSFKAAAMDHLTQHAVPFLESHIKGQNQVIADLTAQLKALQGGKAPAPSGGAPAQNQTPANESIEASARRVWRGGT